MAMVRNIRNMIMAGINDEVVKLAVNYLTNEKAVVRSRMFPYRFYTAYDILDELKNFKEKNFQVYDKNYTKNQSDRNYVPGHFSFSVPDFLRGSENFCHFFGNSWIL